MNTSVTYSSEALGVDASRGWRTSSGHKSFDATYGTVDWSQNGGDISKTGDEKCVAYTYNRNTAKNLTQVVSRTLTTALACGTAPSTVDDVISDSRSYYDGATSLTTAPTFGAVTKTEQLKDWVSGTGTVWQASSGATYDSAGRTLTTTDVKGYVTENTYTPAVGSRVTKVSTKNPMGWTTSMQSNPYWGSTTKQYDANTRLTADVDYDALGRVAKVWQLGWTRAVNPDKPNAKYEYVFAANRDAYPYVKAQTLNADGNYTVEYDITDAQMRTRQIQSYSLGGSGDRVVIDTIYDEFGRAATTYGAHSEPGAPSGTLWWEPEWSVPSVDKNVYDRAGRVTDAIFLSGDGVSNLVEKWRTVTSYEGDLTKVTPPEGGTPSTTVTDIDGDIVALRQHTTGAGVNGAYTATTYSFNGKGQQVKVVDQAGNEWTSSYDAKGRLVRSTDPDKGTSLSAYNDYDELESTTDARGEKLFYTYDKIGRKRQVRDDSETGALHAEWKYDSLYGGQTGFNGQLTQAIRYEPAGSTNAYKWQVRGLNARYQPTGVNYVIPDAETGLGGTYIYAYEYSDVTGALTAVSYPAAGGLVTEELTTDYDSATGLPTRLDTSLTGSTGTMATAAYTAYGERSSSTYKMPGGQWVQDIVTRDEGTRRVTRTTVSRESVSGTVADRNYTYDDAGNITSITDKPAVGDSEKQCFRTDLLGHLTSAWTPQTTADCGTDPTVATLAGPAPCWQDWTYDSTGSRLAEVSHASAGNTARAYDVPAGGKDVVRPHAVTGMTTTAPNQAAATTEYRYDGSGNMICRPVAGSSSNDCDTSTNSQGLSWDSEGELTTVSAGGSSIETNVYDADGNRIIRRDAAGTTLYLPGQEVRKQGSSTIGTRYYTFGGTICGSRKGSSAITDLTWLFTDHQGTQQIAINAGTQAVTIRRQTPFGATRGSTQDWVNGKGFVGGDIDPTGLTNIGARQYDTALGRFISVDPIMDLGDPQQWNAYSYAYNSPVSHADPTGEDPCPGGGGGCYYDGTTTDHDGVTKAQMDEGRELGHKYAAEVKQQKTAEREAEKAAQERDAQRRAQKEKECDASFWCRQGRKAKHAASATMDFMADHADVVGVIAGVGIGLACTALTGGGGAVLCGALGGAVTGLVTAGLQCYGGDESKCSAGSLASETLIGAGLGALGGAGGAVLGGVFKGGLTGMRAAAAALPKQTLGAVREILPQRASVALGGKAYANASSFIRATRSSWGDEASRAGGGVVGHAKIAADTAYRVVKGGRVLLVGLLIWAFMYLLAAVAGAPRFVGFIDWWQRKMVSGRQ